MACDETNLMLQRKLHETWIDFYLIRLNKQENGPRSDGL